MECTLASPSLACPDPLTRAPRLADGATLDRLHRAPSGLQGALAAVVSRDTRGLELSSAQRLTHFPASPLISLCWFQDFDVGLMEQGAEGPAWRSFAAPAVFSGSQSSPIISWAPTTGRGVMACFTADVAQRLFGFDVAAIHDRFVPALEVLGDAWRSFVDGLLNAGDDAAALRLLDQQLSPRWRALQDRASPLNSLRRLGRHWVEGLAWQAHEWRNTHSPRQVERRIKAYSGRSLRQWQSLVKTEGVFFAARDRHAAGQPFDWAGLAADEGFADQAHLVRASKRITGFAPGEFAQRFIEDESFWLYRLWV